MIFYIGEIVNNVIDEKTRLLRNKNKMWAYGYNKEIDTIIISKDGTLGEVYNISGINIGLPQKPEHKKILNWDKTPQNQVWKREELPDGLNESTQYDKKYEDYIVEQFRRRDEGVWIYINGKPIYITGTYWFGIQWVREATYYANFRVIQNELMIFWEACKADYRCFGMQYVKNRRIGASFLAIIELLESGTINEDKILGIVSKKGDDSKKIFNRLIKGFKRLPCFFQPLWDGTNTPKKELILDVPTKKRSKNEVIKDEGLGSSISWHNTELNAMDGEAIFRSLLDESGKYPKDVPFDKYWYIVKTSHTKGIRITGKAMVVSTVNSKKKGGAEYEAIWNDSDISKRDDNGQTVSGLYPLFIAADYCMEGMFDKYGFSIVEDPETEILTDEGVYTKIGAKTFLDNKEKSLKDKPEELNEQKRQFPRVLRDAFRDEASDCWFNLIKINEQIDHNKYELDEDKNYINNLIERGNFSWHNGVKDSTVKWNPDPVNGRFYILRNAHPPLEYRNKKEMKMFNGILANAPVNSEVGCFGVDPYNVTKTSDGRGSYGSIHLFINPNTLGIPEGYVLEYIDRPPKIEIFFEDMIMAMIYFSMPGLFELSNMEFLRLIKNRGYRHFSKNNPYKLLKDLNPTELELGGVPAQNDKIREQQFYTIQAYIEDHIGVARDESERELGIMGIMPFTRTLEQWKDVDPNKRTDYDAYISSSLAKIGSHIIIKKQEKSEPVDLRKLFNTYDNSGNYSKILE